MKMLIRPHPPKIRVEQSKEHNLLKIIKVMIYLLQHRIIKLSVKMPNESIELQKVHQGKLI